jgi:hypothetical protein
MKKLLFVACAIILFSSLILAQTVYITKTGKKYHRETCGYLSQSCIAISLKDAVARGYTPCSRCKPPILNESTTKDENSVSKYKKRQYVSKKSNERVGCICRDGTRSYAIGRGACSHHGGVDHWLYK